MKMGRESYCEIRLPTNHPGAPMVRLTYWQIMQLAYSCDSLRNLVPGPLDCRGDVAGASEDALAKQSKRLEFPKSLPEAEVFSPPRPAQPLTQSNATAISPSLAGFQLGTCKTWPLNSSFTLSGLSVGI